MAIPAGPTTTPPVCLHESGRPRTASRTARLVPAAAAATLAPVLASLILSLAFDRAPDVPFAAALPWPPCSAPGSQGQVAHHRQKHRHAQYPRSHEAQPHAETRIVTPDQRRRLRGQPPHGILVQADLHLRNQ